MTAALLFYVCAAASFAAALLRLSRVRTNPNPRGAQAYGLILVAMAVTFTAMATPTQAWINQSVPDGGKLLGNTSTLVAAFGVVALSLYTRWPVEQAGPKVRRRALWLAVTAAVLLVTFFWPHPVVLTGSFDGLYALDPSLAIYTVAYASYLGIALIDFVRLSLQFIGQAPPVLRWGLRLLATAGALGVTYAASKIAIVVHRLVTGSRAGTGNEDGVCHAAFSSVGCTVAVGGPGLVALLLIAGVVACAYSARLENLAQWTASIRTYRRLEPLWRAVTTAVPEVHRSGLPADDLEDPRDIRVRLNRRYVEIRDGLLLLSPYRIPAPSPGDAHAEAAAIRSAIEAKRAGHEPVHDSPAAPLAHHDSTVDLDRATDTAWLERVAREFTNLQGKGVVARA
ncbi:MAB_1171c family putative transporter [Prauserella endophytica]|uniref:MAB_1171c family putative transporter n=1 Tax=Prauserella endophytica TaxID=1592324 RepID=UPI0013053BD2|nr:MAB_1171c family putative transporter [Prauserella endophytica]